MELNLDQIKQDITEAAERMGLDYEDLAPMVPDVIQDCIPKAAELVQLVETRVAELDKIHAVAHDLKGVCANYGLVAESELAKHVEVNRADYPLDQAKMLKSHFDSLAGMEF